MCEADNDSGGDITSINVENGIIGGASNGDVSLSINTSAIQVRVGGICDPGSSIREIKSNGQVVCEIDDDSVFPMDAVLAVDGENGIYIDRVNMSKVVVFANTSYLQKRVQGHCQAGEAINQIFDDGSIQCESMPVYTLNTTDIRMQQTLQRSCPNGSSIRSISPSGIVTCHVDKDGGGDITSVTVGNGLIGGGISGDVSIAIDYAVVQKRNPESSMCSDGSGVQGLHQNGTLLCTPLFTGDITSIMTGNGLTGGGTGGDVDIDIDFSRVQKRASMASMMCPEGQYVNSLLENGTVLCSIDQNDGGDITAVNLGNGLLGGGSYGDVLVGIDYNIVQYRVASECPAGSAIRTISANGTVECELDNDGGGDITSVTVASGLIGGGDSGDIFVSINTSYVQRRVQQECGLGKYIRRINQDGTVVCVEDNSGGDIFSIGVAHGLLGGGTSGDILLAINFSMVQSRILGSCAQGSSIRAIDSNGSVICEMDDNTFPDGNIVTEVSTGKGLIESGHNASHVRLAVDTGYIQRRISGNCSEGEAIQSILSDGSVLCESMPIYTLNTTAIRMQQTLQSSCPSGSSIQSISASGIVTCHTDIDSGGDISAVTVGNGMYGGGTQGNISVGIDFDVVQRRINTMSCAEGFTMDAIFRNGSVHCAPMTYGDITSVFPGNGLRGGGATGDIIISVNFSRVQQRQSTMACAHGEFIQGITEAGEVECAIDQDSGGDITSISVGSGLTSINATRGDATINVNYNIVQARVDAACPAGSSIRAIHEDGSVSCELDNDSGGDLTSVSVSNGLIGGGQVGDLTISANTSYLQKRINQQCNTGEYMRAIHKDGSVVCEADNDSGGDITSINVENGIIGGASNGDVSLSINTSVIQSRIVGKCEGPGNSISRVNDDGTVVCKSVDGNITQLKAELSALQESLKSIQEILTPLVDRATKQVTAIHPKFSYQPYVVEDALPTLQLTGASSGGFVAILPLSTVGCAGSHEHYYVVSSTNTIDLSVGLIAGMYKVCHALQQVDGTSSSSHYWEQTATLNVVKSPFVALGLENAAPFTFMENVTVSVNVTRSNATNKDVLVLLPKHIIGCHAATNASTKFILSKDVNAVEITIHKIGVYKVCYAPEGGDSSGNYIELGDTFTVTSRMAAVVVDYAKDLKVSRSTKVTMRFNYDPDITVNGMITYSKLADTGCRTTQDGTNPPLVSQVNEFTTPGIAVVGMYKLCFNRTDTGQILNVVEGNITTISAQYARSFSSLIATSNQAELVVIDGAALAIRLNHSANNVRMYDSVAVVAATAKNCKSSAGNAIQILSLDDSVLIPPEKLPKDTGMAKLCLAPFSNTNLTDNAFLEQGIQIEIIDPELAIMTYKTEPAGTYSFLEIESPSAPTNIAVLPVNTTGCYGALSAATAYSQTTIFGLNPATVNSKVCFAPSPPTSDYDFIDQGYLLNQNDPKLIIDETFVSEEISHPTGLARDPTNGDLYISSRDEGKIYKVTSGGVKSEFYTGLSEPWGIDIDSSTGDIFVAEKAAGKITRITQNGVASTYTTGQTLITAIARHDTTGDMYFTTGYANADLKRIDENGTVTQISNGIAFTRPKSLRFRENTTELYMALGDVQSNSVNVTGTPVIYHIDVSTKRNQRIPYKCGRDDVGYGCVCPSICSCRLIHN